MTAYFSYTKQHRSTMMICGFLRLVISVRFNVRVIWWVVQISVINEANLVPCRTSEFHYLIANILFEMFVLVISD